MSEAVGASEWRWLDVTDADPSSVGAGDFMATIPSPFVLPTIDLFPDWVLNAVRPIFEQNGLYDSNFSTDAHNLYVSFRRR